MMELMVANTTMQDHYTESTVDQLIYINKFDKVVITGSYINGTRNNGVVLMNGKQVVLVGNIIERCMNDGVVLDSVSQSVIVGNEFDDIGYRTIRIIGNSPIWKIDSNLAYNVRQFLRCDVTGSVLGSSCNFNTIRPKGSPAIEVLVEQYSSIRNLNVIGNDLYWFTDTYTNSGVYAINIEAYNLNLVNVSKNIVGLRSNNADGGTSGIKVDGKHTRDGVIVNDNMVDQCKTSAGRVPFKLPSSVNGKVVVSNNLSVREV